MRSPLGKVKVLYDIVFLLQISFGWQKYNKSYCRSSKKCRYLYLLTENKMMDKIAIFLFRIREYRACVF